MPRKYTLTRIVRYEIITCKGSEAKLDLVVVFWGQPCILQKNKEYKNNKILK
jgi:hypothetical protein